MMNEAEEDDAVASCVCRLISIRHFVRVHESDQTRYEIGKIQDQQWTPLSDNVRISQFLKTDIQTKIQQAINPEKDELGYSLIRMRVELFCVVKNTFTRTNR